MSDLPVLVAGGGIAGLASALGLAARGVDTLVIEREPVFSEIGAGLQLGPNAVHALKAIAAWDAVEPVTSQPPEIHIRDGSTGALLRRITLGTAFTHRFGAPYRVAHRADLHAALLACARGNRHVQLLTGEAVAGCHEDGDGIVASGDSGKRWRGQALLAADGLHSPLRQQVFAGSGVADTGHVFYRALMPTRPESDGIAFDCVNLWLCAGTHVVHYPVGRAGYLNTVFIAPTGQPRAVVMDRMCPALIHILSYCPTWREWPALHVKPLATWTRGRVTLAGDAAHGTLPYLAQGAAMALEDAAALTASATLPDGRRLRTLRLHRQTVQSGRIYHLSGLAAQARNLALRHMPEDRFLARLAWIYDYRGETNRD